MPRPILAVSKTENGFWRWLISDAGEAFRTAGGWGGVAGALIWFLLTQVFDLSVVSGVLAALLIVTLFLLAASFGQYSQQLTIIKDQTRTIAQLRSRPDPEKAMLDKLFRLSHSCRTLSELGSVIK